MDKSTKLLSIGHVDFEWYKTSEGETAIYNIQRKQFGRSIVNDKLNNYMNFISTIS